MTKRRFISDQELENSLELIATLVEWYGEDYWPIFERLESELEQRQSRIARLRARRRDRPSITQSKQAEYTRAFWAAVELSTLSIPPIRTRYFSWKIPQLGVIYFPLYFSYFCLHFSLLSSLQI